MTTTPVVNTTFFLTGLFSPSTTMPSTPISNFFISDFNSTHTVSFPSLSLTAGTTYSVLIAFNNGTYAADGFTFSMTGPGCILINGRTCATGIDSSQPSYAASNLGSTVNPSFTGGTLTLDQPGASYGQNFTVDNSSSNTIDERGNTATFTGVFSNATTTGNLVVANSSVGGGVVFTGVNTYTGATTIDAGATLALAGSGSIAASSGLTSNGNFDISATSGASITDLAGGGTVALGSRTLTLTSAASTFAGVIAGAGGAVTVAGGTATFSGSNLYTGPTTVNAGATLALSGSGSLAASSGLTSNGNFDISATTGASIADLAGSGTVALGSRTLTLTRAASPFGGVISDGGAGGGVTVAGGQATFSGVNSYSGATTIGQSGALALTGNGSIAASSGVDNAGLLDLTQAQSVATIQALTGAGLVLLGPNGLAITNAKGTFSGAVAPAPGGALAGNVAITGGTETLTGQITTGGRLTLEASTLFQNGSVVAGGGVIVGGTATLRGTGTIGGGPSEVSGILAPGNSPGTLSFTAPVTMTNGSTLLLDMDGTGTGAGAGNYSRVVVNGADFNVAGGFIVPRLRGIGGSASNGYTPPLGTVFNVVAASGGVSGSFSDLVQPSSGLLAGSRLDALYFPTAINLYVTPASYGALSALGVAETANQSQIGFAVDGLRPTQGVRVDPATTAVLDRLYRLGAPSIPDALESLSSDIYGDLLLDGIARNRAMADAIDGQTLAGRGFAAPSGPTKVRLGALTMWVSGVGTIGSVDGQGGRKGWSQSSGGGVAGIERQFDRFVVGLAVGGSGGQVSAGSQRAATQSIGGGAYAAWRGGRWFASGQVDMYGTDDAVTRSAGLMGAEARGTVQGLGVGAGAEAGVTFSAGTARVEPFAGLRVDYLNHGSADETAVGPLAVRVAGRDLTAVRSRLGVRVQATLPLGGTTITPIASLAWAHELGDVSTVTEASFVGSSAMMRLGSRAGGRNAAEVMLGATMPIAASVAVYASYAADLREGASGHAFRGGLNWSW